MTDNLFSYWGSGCGTVGRVLPTPEVRFVIIEKTKIKIKIWAYFKNLLVLY